MQTFSSWLRVVLLLTAAWPATTRAQQVNAVGVYCSVHQRTYPCNGTADCDREWAKHLEQMHSGDGGDYWSRGPVASFSMRMDPGRAALKALLLGGIVGALAGSLAPGPDPDTRQEPAGVLIGSGTFFAAGVLSNRTRWSRTATTVHGALAGAALAGGAGKAMERSPKGSPERKAEQERTTAAAVQGLPVGAAAGFFIPSISKRVGGRLRPDSRWRRLQVVSRSTYVGLRWSW